MNEEIKKAIEVLRSGGVILYPTDTVWGIGCDATDSEAVQKVYDLKRRADSKSMLVLTDSVGKIGAYVKDMPALAWDLIEMSERPLTIIYSDARNLAENIIAEDGSIGIRVTKEAFSKTLCERFRKPVVSTSANVSGEPAPENFAEISEEIKNGVDYIVNFRQNERTKAKPSSIIKLETGNIVKIIRE
ncbi:MAG: threonylcarbamoyl-AMP synthase [Prevotellaceae bacterium]|jgi:L-threonylcarbamoyladenylate synthase|nr:threonylcarbamoyl-AMP synthase [Prevotellaceae bacterium]